jgi:hypothetical protein
MSFHVSLDFFDQLSKKVVRKRVKYVFTDPRRQHSKPKAKRHILIYQTWRGSDVAGFGGLNFTRDMSRVSLHILHNIHLTFSLTNLHNIHFTFSLTFISFLPFRSPALFQIHLWGGLLIFCGFVVYDTQAIMEKRRRGDKDAIRHSLDLFIDFLHLFRKILILLLQKVCVILWFQGVTILGLFLSTPFHFTTLNATRGRVHWHLYFCRQVRNIKCAQNIMFRDLPPY